MSEFAIIWLAAVFAGHRVGLMCFDFRPPSRLVRSASLQHGHRQPSCARKDQGASLDSNFKGGQTGCASLFAKALRVRRHCFAVLSVAYFLVVQDGQRSKQRGAHTLV